MKKAPDVIISDTKDLLFSLNEVADQLSIQPGDNLDIRQFKAPLLTQVESGCLPLLQSLLDWMQGDNIEEVEDT